MTNTKDKQNKITVRNEDSSKLSIRNNSESSFKLLAEKGQKIVTAIYMITSVLSETDPMYSLIRDKSVEAMKCLFNNLLKNGDETQLNNAQHNLYELLSYLSVINKIGRLSQMNYDILFKEISLLQKSIKREFGSITTFESNDNSHSFSLSNIFTDEGLVKNKLDIKEKDSISNILKKDDKEDKKNLFTEKKEDLNILNKDKIIDNLNLNIKDDNQDKNDIAKEDFLKDTEGMFTEDELDLMSLNEELSVNNDELIEDEYFIDDYKEDNFINDFKESDEDYLKDGYNEPSNEYDSSYKKDAKSERHEDILNILAGKKDASITDICFFFEDCSSKTIQRDLKELIKEDKVVKSGDRRWATYNIKR